MKPDSPQVEMEDRFCNVIWNFLSHLLSERCGSSVYQSDHYPGLLAGMLGSPEEAEQTMGRFFKDWSVYCEARKVNAPDVVMMCERSSLNTSAMSQFARLCKKGGWKITAEVRERVEVFFGGVMQEDILEDSLGKVRDTEYRDQSSRVLKLFKAYEVPVRNGQLKRWDRNEIETQPEIDIEGGKSGFHDDLFEPKPRDDEMNLRGVMSTNASNKWQTFTPATLRNVPAEKFLL